MDNVYLLPNGVLSNGQRVVKLTKTQQKLGRQLAKMDEHVRNMVLEYTAALEIYTRNSGKARPIVPQKY